MLKNINIYRTTISLKTVEMKENIFPGLIQIHFAGFDLLALHIYLSPL